MSRKHMFDSFITLLFVGILAAGFGWLAGTAKGYTVATQQIRSREIPMCMECHDSGNVAKKHLEID